MLVEVLGRPYLQDEEGHRHPVYYDESGRAYFVVQNDFANKIYLDEFTL